ncbi:hypothetical protein NPX13_g3371 [Xylaria arbuscula]|uniref:Aminotransferase class I/classII large domain-containing protein n=1 Tax=Xylaria arbuscula TaxID=114810 RepID=A0A9W8NIC7_9PEZI|nr:hypothetical protein NPX13_g3371 [Xylaria arbuscula]
MSMGIVSSRGAAIAERIPSFFDVLQNLWDPINKPNGVVNLGLAENALMQTEMQQFLNSKVRNYTPWADPHSLTYGDGFTGSDRLKSALCGFLNQQFSPCRPVIPSHLLVTSGASNAIECCAWSLCDPEDYVLIGRPYWTTFKTMFANRARVNVQEVEFGSTDPFSLEAVEHYEETYREARQSGKNIRAILLCNPHNPLGRCYSKKVLERYMKFCHHKQIHLISDEIYALSVHTEAFGEPFTSALSIETQSLIEPELVHVVWGMSKDFGATGLRIGCLVNQSNELFLKASTSISLFNFPSSLADNAVAAMFADRGFTDNFITVYRKRLHDSYEHMMKTLESHGIPCQKSNATLFIWANLRAAIKDDSIKDDDILRRCREEGVYITSGEGYRSEYSGWFRIVFAHPKQTLDEGLRRIIRTLETL